MEGREVLAGRYEVRGLLGRGGMAEVYDGWDTRLSRAVAIKLLYPAFKADADARHRFETEAQAAASLNHPNIVAVHDCGDHNGTPFIVMERLPGRTLDDEIAAGPMAQHRVRAMLDDVLGALATAHAAGVVHRDIKPGNVLVTDDDGAMKVADFGIAKTAGAALTATGQIVGTMAYMSRERVAGAPASVADDLYAVGVMSYEALSGRRPYPQ
ncbi:MAG: serine/threonine-protein kinase, partial [Mycobacterium sp.]